VVVEEEEKKKLLLFNEYKFGIFFFNFISTSILLWSELNGKIPTNTFAFKFGFIKAWSHFGLLIISLFFKIGSIKNNECWSQYCFNTGDLTLGNEW